MASLSFLETVPLEHLPPKHAVYAALFKDVKNSASIHAQLLARNPDFEYAFLDAGAAISRVHVLAATFKAVTALLASSSASAATAAEQVAEVGPGGGGGSIGGGGNNNGVAGGLKTPNVHSEIVLSMGASNNIAEAYKRFGISPATTTSIIVIKVAFPSASTSSATALPSQNAQTASEIWDHLTANISGTPIPFTDENIALETDWSKVHKTYKINGPVLGRIDTMTATDDKVREKEVIALGAMALRGT